MTFTKLPVVTCIGALVASCSSITPTRITDKNEVTAVGLRYYETRPFIVVRQPYVIASEPFLVHGVLQADGRTFVVVDAPPELALPTRTLLTIGVPAPARARTASGGDVEAQAQSGDADEEKPAEETKPKAGCKNEKPKEGAGAADAATETDGEKPKEEGNVPECKDTTGSRLAFSGISLETDLSGTALIPVNDLFSIVYLPDYDREFVVDVKARWGFSKLHITRGPGGALLAYNSEVDNSAVVKPLFDAWNTLVTAATKAAVVKITPPTAQSGDVSGKMPKSNELSGTPATLRIHRVKYSVPGVYPMVKPSEVGTGKWGQASYPVDKRMLVPAYPYQVPYDYFTVLLAEHLLEPAGSSGVLSGSVEQGGAAQSVEALSKPPVAPVAPSCPAVQRRAPTTSTPTSLSLALGPGLGNAIVSAKKTDGSQESPRGCLTKMDVTFNSQVTDQATVQNKLNAKYPNTQFNVTPAL